MNLKTNKQIKEPFNMFFKLSEIFVPKQKLIAHAKFYSWNMVCLEDTGEKETRYGNHGYAYTAK